MKTNHLFVMKKITYTARDVAGIAGFSVVAGIVFAIWSYVVAQAVFIPFGYLGIAAIYGMWFIGGTMVGYIIRKPGAAVLGETIGAHLELLTGSPFTIYLLYYGVAQGLGSEIAFAMGKYKRWGYGIMALAGLLPALFAFPFDYYISAYYQYYRFGFAPDIIAGLLTGYIASGVILGGIMVKFLVDSAVKAGALKGWVTTSK